jgi:BON domain
MKTQTKRPTQNRRIPIFLVACCLLAAQGLQAQLPDVFRPVQPPLPPSISLPPFTPPALTPPPVIPPSTTPPLFSAPPLTPLALAPPSLSPPYSSVMPAGGVRWNQSNNRAAWTGPYTDQELFRNVLLQFSADPLLYSTEIQVEVHRRIVALSGTVPAWRDYSRAQQDAVRAGAAYVVNRLRVARR